MRISDWSSDVCASDLEGETINRGGDRIEMTGHIIYEFVVFLIWHGRNYAGTRCLRTDLRRCFTTDASLVLKERVSVNSGSASRAPYRSGKSLGISSAIVIRVPITESRADALILALIDRKSTR